MPTVIGRLSFRVIGETHYPSSAEYSNVRIGDHQYVVAHQSRHLSDVLFPALLSGLFGVDGDWDFFLVARSRLENPSPSARLIGKLYLFRTLSHQRRSIERDLRNLFGRFRQIEQNPFHATEVLAAYTETHTLLSANCEISANVVLQRNGVISISNIKWSNDAERENSISHANAEDLDIDAVIADQFYFFVRDITHKHQHHSPDADTILTMHLVTSANISWCNSIVYSLYFHIVTMKREEDSAEQVRATGILAYIDTFQKIVSQQGFSAVPEFYPDNARRSLEATKGYTELLLARKREHREFYKSISIWIGGAALSLFGLVLGFSDENVPSSEIMVSFANWTKANGWIILLAPTIVAMIYITSLILYRGSKKWKETRRDIIRLMLVSRRISIAIILLIAIFTTWLTVELINRFIQTFSG